MTMRMRPGPAVALLLLVGLGAWVYFDELKGRRGAPKDETTKDRAIAFDRKDLKAIRIKNGHGEVRLERNGEAWTITDPLATGTDKDSVDGLLSSLEFARVERRLGATADLKGYGLEPPKATLSLDLQGAGGSPTARTSSACATRRFSPSIPGRSTSSGSSGAGRPSFSRSRRTAGSCSSRSRPPPTARPSPTS